MERQLGLDFVHSAPLMCSSRMPRTRRSGRGRIVKLLERRGHLSPARRRVAEYVLRQYQDVAFMGVAELAKAAKVSPAAVVRFSTSLNFNGYPEFKRALHDIVRGELRQDERLSAVLQDRSPRLLATRIIDQELRNLATLKSTFDPHAWKQVVSLILPASAITVVGFRASSTLAHYLWYNLRKVKTAVTLYATPGSVTLDDLALGDRKTLIIFISFPRYSEELLDLARFCKSVGYRSLGITDNELSPLVPLCERMLFTEVGEASFTDFDAAPITLLNALVADIAAHLGHDALRRLKQLDDLAAEQGYLFRPSFRPSTKGKRRNHEAR